MVESYQEYRSGGGKLDELSFVRIRRLDISTQIPINPSDLAQARAMSQFTHVEFCPEEVAAYAALRPIVPLGDQSLMAEIVHLYSDKRWVTFTLAYPNIFL